MPRTLKQVAIDMANAFTRWQLWQGGGSTTLSDLTDVELSDLQSDDVLKYDGNKWINAIIQGGGSVGAKIDTLWSGMCVANGTIQLNYDYNDYDLIVCCSRIAPTIDFQEKYDIGIKGFKSISGGAYTNNYYMATYRLQNWNITSCELEILNTPSGWQPTLTQIKGIKFAPIEQNLHEYSTNEKVVGTWIDGKPVYEKVVEISNFTIPSYTWIVLPSFPSNIKEVIDFKCFEKNDGVWWSLSVGKGGHCYSFRSNVSITINTYIVRYTKTTD